MVLYKLNLLLSKKTRSTYSHLPEEYRKKSTFEKGKKKKEIKPGIQVFQQLDWRSEILMCPGTDIL